MKSIFHPIIIYAPNNASLPLLLPRLSNNSVAVAHHGTRLGLTDEARLGAVVVVRRIVVVGVVGLMMGIVVVMVSVQIQHRHRHIVVVVVRHNRVGQQKDIGQQQEHYGHRAFHTYAIINDG